MKDTPRPYSPGGYPPAPRLSPWLLVWISWLFVMLLGSLRELRLALIEVCR